LIEFAMRFAALLLACAACVITVGGAPDDVIMKHYGSFKSPVFNNTSFDAVKMHLMRGVPMVIKDGARGLPMASWTCDYVKKEFPKSRIRQEGGRSDTNDIPMTSDWTAKQSRFPAADDFPEGAPKMRPFYWDIAKASQDEHHRQWGANPEKVVRKLVQKSAVPYWLPGQDAANMGQSSEMWFHPPGAGAPAHMDPHCQTTVSFCFSGKRKWRMMLPPSKPHPQGYFDGEIYGARDKSRRGEWEPTFEFEAPAGSAVLVYPGKYCSE